MLVTSLEKMEDLVKSNRSLRWEGWDVLHSYPSPTGWMSKQGTFYKGRWFITRRFAITNTGWNIPDKFVRQNAKK